LHTHWAEAAIFRPPRRGSLAQAITDHLRRRIVSGDLPAGRRLPSVRKLAHLFKVSVPTIESAIHALATLGFVRISRGVGIYVASPRDQTALLNYVWRAASIAELGVVRAAIDERAAPLVARQVATHPELRLPRTLADINFFAHERSLSRIGGPQSFLDADLMFHNVVLASLRGFEIGPAIYERVCDRLGPALLAVADVQSADAELDHAHLALTSAILDGDAAAATRLARTMAGRELRSLEVTLG
jgi:GntR family transcriptional repressor for pyruvate dehydrogenase complex